MQAYKQTTPYTGSASSLMMVINHFNPSFLLTKENEFRIWQKTVALPTKDSSLFGIALFALNNGLKLTITGEDLSYSFPDYRFKGYKLEEVEEAKFSDELFQKEAEKVRILTKIQKITLCVIKKYLEDGKILLLEMNAGIIRNSRSYDTILPVYKYGDGKFVAIDPFDGQKKFIHEEQMQESLDTLRTKCKRAPKMIVLEKMTILKELKEKVFVKKEEILKGHEQIKTHIPKESIKKSKKLHKILK